MSSVNCIIKRLGAQKLCCDFLAPDWFSRVEVSPLIPSPLKVHEALAAIAAQEQSVLTAATATSITTRAVVREERATFLCQTLHETKIMITLTILITAVLDLISNAVAATDSASGAPAHASLSTPGIELIRQMNKLSKLCMRKNNLRGQEEISPDSEGGESCSCES